MTRLNCPNCGAPIDIHRKDCEYCGTPYDLKDQEVLYYADNQVVYITESPIKHYEDEVSRLSRELSQLIQCNAISMASARDRLNAVASQNERLRQRVNAYPKVNYGSLIEEPKDEATGYIWETIKTVLVTVAFFLPVLIPIILGALDIF